MKRYVVLGVNENPKYLYYLPLVVWGWRQFGWEPIVFNASNNDTSPKVLATHSLMVKTIPKDYDLSNILFTQVQGYKSETIAQVSRLYGCCVAESRDDLLMMSDVDMLPLSNYWEPEVDSITAYGRDLSDEHYPMCYVAAKAGVWHRVIMDLCDIDYNSMIKRDLDRVYPKAKNKWTVDQDLLTENINQLPSFWVDKLKLIPRGTDKRTGYPIGRVDRSNWRLDHPKLIDAHLPHDILTNEKSFHNVMQLLHTVWPTTDFKWFLTYHREFKKLL